MKLLIIGLMLMSGVGTVPALLMLILMNQDEKLKNDTLVGDVVGFVASKALAATHGATSVTIKPQEPTPVGPEVDGYYY